MIGIFIGSFNPPTLAHIEIAKILSKKYNQVIFVPVNSREKHLKSLNDRVAMLRIIKRKNPFIIVDDIMKNYSYLNYRIIDILKRKYHNIELILGSDLLVKLNSFDNYEYLLKNYSFMVVSRNNIDDKKIVQEKYPDYVGHFHYLKYQNEISSTLVRELIQKNESVGNLIDCDVYGFIRKNNLYF